MKNLTTFLSGSMVLAAVLVSSAAHADEEVEVAPPASPDPSAVPAPVLAPAPSPTVAPQEAPRAQQPTLTLGAGCTESPSGCGAEGARASSGSRWYGYQTLLTDTAAVLLGFSAAATGPVGGVASVSTYFLGAPIVHLAHGNYGAFGASLGMRTVGPVLGGFTGLGLGALADGCRGGGDSFCGAPLVTAFVGVVGGMLAAVAVDAAVLSKEPREPKLTAKRWDGKPVLAPSFAPSTQGATFGFGGAF
ncbi:MAG: hypothetical protein IPK71_01525 [Myxococcales bacterium]|nr:hypothetical protein [Myxococcales bacterium]